MWTYLLAILVTLVASHFTRDFQSKAIHRFAFSPQQLPPPLRPHQLQTQLGEHVLLEVQSSPSHLLNNLPGLKQAARAILTRANLTVVAIQGHQFAPQGISVVAVLAESHLSVHTWPELGYAAGDIYTCGLEIPGRAEQAAQGIVEYLQAKEHHMSVVGRGIPFSHYLTRTASTATQPDL